MITQVQDVYYNVADMEQAVKFYRDVLGLKVTDEDAHFTGLEVGGVRIGLHWTGGRPVPAVPKNAHGADAGATLTLRVADIEAAQQRLRENLVKILGTMDAPWGRLVTFQDPDGNVLKLMEVPREM
jgi:predicted enzyme related to lactoylglutathione lyase